ncbi:hypothetical protein ACVQ92_09000 [Staphylococcus aureus]
MCTKLSVDYWISSVTKKAIQQGFKNLKDGRQYNDLYYAALARSEADWIVGIMMRALTTKYDAHSYPWDVFRHQRFN